MVTEAAASPAGQIDPSKSVFCAAFGKKGEGKSVLCGRLFDTYPYDRLAIDVTGDIWRLQRQADWIRLTDPLPVKWPQPREEEVRRQTLVYVPDMGSPTHLDDIDRAIGLAYQHGRTLVWVDEIGVVAKVQKTGPWMRRALHQGRHVDLSLLMAGPRPKDIDPLCVAQADYVYVFRLPNPDDRERVVKNIGWDRAEFDNAVDGLPSHGYLRYDAVEDELVEWPPLPTPTRSSRRP